MDNFRSVISESRGLLLILLVVVLLVGLPAAMWLNLRNLTETTLLRQARDLNSAVTSMRAYYGTNVVGRILDSPGSTQVTHIHPRCHSDPSDPLPRAWTDNQRAAAEHQLPLRLEFSLQESRAAPPRPFRSERADGAAQQSQPATDQRVVIDL
jgi:hypothetical protein